MGFYSRIKTPTDKVLKKISISQFKKEKSQNSQANKVIRQDPAQEPARTTVNRIRLQGISSIEIITADHKNILYD